MRKNEQESHLSTYSIATLRVKKALFSLHEESGGMQRYRKINSFSWNIKYFCHEKVWRADLKKPLASSSSYEV